MDRRRPRWSHHLRRYQRRVRARPGRLAQAGRDRVLVAERPWLRGGARDAYPVAARDRAPRGARALAAHPPHLPPRLRREGGRGPLHGQHGEHALHARRGGLPVGLKVGALHRRRGRALRAQRGKLCRRGALCAAQLALGQLPRRGARVPVHGHGHATPRLHPRGGEADAAAPRRRGRGPRHQRISLSSHWHPRVVRAHRGAPRRGGAHPLDRVGLPVSRHERAALLLMKRTAAKSSSGLGVPAVNANRVFLYCSFCLSL
mmetsp:Transcript_17320/g.46750  ORF Transcript_17320/g.46750 Transcript_17320/m.46750 type:complete len:260 (-) Transcript_17320:226-1005(-)